MRRLTRPLLAGAAVLLAAPAVAGDVQRGERVFAFCYACHSVKPGENGLTGPNLRGVVGRKAANVAGFDYSPALRAKAKAGLEWTERALDQYLADPETMVPGTSMIFNGIPDARDRADVIAYLKRTGKTK
ncbi:MAG: c-type cytochrome [Alphaproteobacteria bacterium]